MRAAWVKDNIHERGQSVYGASSTELYEVVHQSAAMPGAGGRNLARNSLSSSHAPAAEACGDDRAVTGHLTPPDTCPLNRVRVRVTV